MTPPALQVQEICDYICEFLHSSPAELRAWALVSTAFTLSAQLHLFHHIDLAKYGRTGNTGNAPSASRRLCTILAGSPHLIPLIRHLKISFAEDVLSPLTQVLLTHVETIVLRPPSPQHPQSHTVSSLAAPLLALPSVRRLTLGAIAFENIQSLHALFRQRTSAFDRLTLHYVDLYLWGPMGAIAEGTGTQQHIGVKELEIAGPDRHSDWLGHPLSTFNFSALDSVDIWGPIRPSVVALMHSSGSTLHTLRLDAEQATCRASAFRLDEFIWLKYIDVFGGCNTVSCAVIFFESAGSAELRLEHIVLRVGLMGPVDRDSLRRADDAIAEMNSPHLRGVHCKLSTGTAWSGPLHPARLAGMVRGAREAFPRLNARGYLRVSCVDDGICTEL
ncbi:hypothetical protein DFH08DRAFT_161049 [Mycena albidolilacea]|uniref:Uncharacterized protein n=1 Tax=Mycena albidolilacea TaxID=1033008 RepID=A0AAD7ER14_9AGAR|nr:hypothetical protein DFH08DRAFT_161049 [Mycena albidolilacea]